MEFFCINYKNIYLIKQIGRIKWLCLDFVWSMENMDRAAKVKKYRKKMMKNRYRRRPQVLEISENRFKFWLLTAGIVSAGLLFSLIVVMRSSSQRPELTYVTREEAASLMCFLEEDSLLEQWKEDPKLTVTQGQLKDFVQKIGLSDAIRVQGGNEKLERSVFMDYYDQILDYMDLAESVEKKTVLLLAQDGNICQTQYGEYVFQAGSVRLEDFYTYDMYVMEHRILGIRAQSEKTIALRDVSAAALDQQNIEFEYEKNTYQVSCKNMEGFTSSADCTLCIKGGVVTKIKNIRLTENNSTVKSAPEQAADTEKKALSDTVKVLLLNQGAVHYEQVYLTCDGQCYVKKNRSKKKYAASQLINIKKLKLKKGKYISVEPAKSSGRLYLSDAKGRRISKGYYGSITVYRDNDGYYIVNKVGIEKYLYSVVASEMPSSFGLEALKAQAVCARSYVYRQMAKGDYEAYHAQIDDSTNYQVYNKSDISEADIKAVEATAGEVMYAQGEIVNAYYFSCSCGYTSGMEIWNQKDAYPYLKAKSLNPSEKGSFDLSKEKTFRKYITSSNEKAFDGDSRYFRWTAKAEPSACLKEIKQKIQQREKINPQNFAYYARSGKSEKKVSSLKGFGGIEQISSLKRSKSGAVLALNIVFEFGRVEVRSEYNIRSVLGCALEKITYADGTEDQYTRFLPSAYFSIKFNAKSRRYELSGGGNGHGMGMSQYGADRMSKQGWDYKKILKYYYSGVSVKAVSK